MTTTMMMILMLMCMLAAVIGRAEVTQLSTRAGTSQERTEQSSTG